MQARAYVQHAQTVFRQIVVALEGGRSWAGSRSLDTSDENDTKRSDEKD